MELKEAMRIIKEHKVSLGSVVYVMCFVEYYGVDDEGKIDFSKPPTDVHPYEGEVERPYFTYVEEGCDIYYPKEVEEGEPLYYALYEVLITRPRERDKSH